MENWCWFVFYNNIGNFDIHCRSSFLENCTREKAKNKLPTTFTSFSWSVLLSTIALDQSVCKKLLSYGKKHNVRWPHKIGMSEKLRPWKLRTQTPPPENQIFRYPIIHRLIPSPSQFEIRQWQMLCFEVVTLRTLTTITGLEKKCCTVVHKIIDFLAGQVSLKAYLSDRQESSRQKTSKKWP